jgi:putative membrane protein
MSPAVQSVFADWEFPWGLTASLLITAAIYLRGWFAIRKTRPQQFSAGQLAWFLSGLAVLWISVGSPMDGFADALLSAHMIEHLLIMSLAPPLLLLGLPTVPLLRGLPRPVIKRILAPLMRTRWFQRLLHGVDTPVFAWLAMNVTFLGWHLPAAYDFALESEGWHAVEHLCFLFTSLLFWSHIIQPWPARRNWNWGIIFYLISADVVDTGLSAFLTFCDRPVYTYYADHPNLFNVSLLRDQSLGAAAMWVLGSIAFIVPGVAITAILLEPRQLGSSSELSRFPSN